MNIEKTINKWFEMKYQTYDKLEHENSIYFYYEGDEYAEIMIDKKDKFIYFQWKFYDEFSQIISLQYIEFDEFITKWFDDTFGLKGFTPLFPIHYPEFKRMMIPK